MITIAAITSQISDALSEHARWNKAVKTLALADGDSVWPMTLAIELGIPVRDADENPVPPLRIRRTIVARLDGCERELQALHKIQLSLITHGREKTPSDAPEAQSAHMTPPADSAAS